VGQRYGREPFLFDVCADCGFVVADREVHDAWHERVLAPSGASSRMPLPMPMPFPLPLEAERFGFVLFDVAQEHLDPERCRLQWSGGFTGSPGPGPSQEWGRKFGWAAPDDTGQAMVYVAVGTKPERDRLPCGQYDNPRPSPGQAHTMPDRSSAQVLLKPDRLELHWSRPDGSYVFAIVDATFRNNSLTPSSAPLPTLDQLEAFVMDPRLVLP
jgi:hypothetical protein